MAGRFPHHAAIVALGVACALAAPVRAATAASFAGGARVRVGHQVDVARFRRVVERRYHLDLRRIVAGDIDRDGDIDVVAATDHGFIVWVNDGSGHLVSHATPVPGIASRAQIGLRRRADARPDVALQDETPSGAMLAPQAHGPPSLVTFRTITFAFGFPLSRTATLKSPRAPPLDVLPQA
jgi:hypothetical protein